MDPGTQEIVVHNLKTIETSDFRNPCLRNYWRGYRAAMLLLDGKGRTAEYTNLEEAAARDAKSLNEFITKMNCRPACVWDEKGEGAL